MADTILIIEDHPLFSLGLAHLAAEIAGNNRVRTVASAEAALQLIDDLPPDHHVRLILCDLSLPGLSGVEAITLLCKACPDAVLLVVSASEDRRDVTAAFLAGAKAFISKAAPSRVVLETVQRVLLGGVSGEIWIPAPSSSVSSPELKQLSSRQQEILRALAQGHPNREISLRLGIAEITVKQHVSLIFRKLNVVNRIQAVAVARKLGLLQ